MPQVHRGPFQSPRGLGHCLSNRTRRTTSCRRWLTGEFGGLLLGNGLGLAAADCCPIPYGKSDARCPLCDSEKLLQESFLCPALDTLGNRLRQEGVEADA